MKIVKNNLCDDGLAPREHVIDVDGMRWHTREWGDHGAPFVLWHGINSISGNWWRVGPFLAGMGFHVWAPDMPGHGRSGDAESYSVEHTARLLDGWMAALRLENPIVLGHSWGGLNALVHALLPDPQVRPRAISLEDPALKLMSDPESRVSSFTDGLGTPRDEAYDHIAAANPRWHACDAWWEAEARELTRRSATEGVLFSNRALDLIERLRELSIPTYVLLGDNAFGGIWPVEQAEQVRAMKLPHVTVDIVPESSHSLHRDAWIHFSMALGAWVQRSVTAKAS